MDPAAPSQRVRARRAFRPAAHGGEGRPHGWRAGTRPAPMPAAATSPAAASAGYGSGTIAETVIGGALVVFAVAGLGLVLRRRRRPGGGSRRSGGSSQRKPRTPGRTTAPAATGSAAWPRTPPARLRSRCRTPTHPVTRPRATPAGRSAPPPTRAGPAGSDGQDWPYPDHPAGPRAARAARSPRTTRAGPPATSARPVGAAVGLWQDRRAADRPGWPYSRPPELARERPRPPARRR